MKLGHYFIYEFVPFHPFLKEFIEKMREHKFHQMMKNYEIDIYSKNSRLHDFFSLDMISLDFNFRNQFGKNVLLSAEFDKNVLNEFLNYIEQFCNINEIDTLDFTEDTESFSNFTNKYFFTNEEKWVIQEVVQKRYNYRKNVLLTPMLPGQSMAKID